MNHTVKNMILVLGRAAASTLAIDEVLFPML